MNDYYGVGLGEVRSGRLAYDSADSMDVFARIRLHYGLNAKWNLFLMFQNMWLGGEITDGPIVYRHHTTSLIIGLLNRL